MTSDFKKYMKFGSLCVLLYCISYYMRNILSVFAPILLENSIFTKEFIASLSSSYFFVYAVGQLINGIIGDIIRPKYMISAGYMLAAAALALFPFTTSHWLCVLLFAVMGFGFSMLRGPLVKIISENTSPEAARICCLFLSLACTLGPLIASFFAIIMKWNTVFIFSGILAFFLSISSFIILSAFEKRQLIKPLSVQKKSISAGDILQIFKLDKFILYMILTMICEICGSSISFWIPTYINEQLHFSSKICGIIFSVISFIKAGSSFICLLMFRLFKKKDMLLMRVFFVLSAASFLSLCFISNPWINLFFLMVALLSTACASGVIWIIYIPSLGKSGKVSGANGTLDCMGYAAAAVCNIAFASIMSAFGWTGLTLAWSAIITAGAFITLLGKNTDTVCISDMAE